MKRALEVTFGAILLAFVALAAQFALPQEQGVVGDPIRGGRLYDNWMLALDTPPREGDHPLWQQQESNLRRGVVTWRCAECHGWDYKGVDGAYGPYSTHYTGFPGLDGMIGASHEEVLDWLDGTNNPDHNFLAYTTSTALDNLAAFLRTRQIDSDLLINPATGEAFGDRESGQALFLGNCTDCHGSQGDLINFGTTAAPLFLGDIAVVDPWQTIHKIRFGTATTTRMPAYEEQDWSLGMLADTLAHMQTLRRGDPENTLINPDRAIEIEVESQAQMEPIVWATFAIVIVVFFSVLAGYVSERGSKPEP
jgi:mono/diheme cytochrome c family protein